MNLQQAPKLACRPEVKISCQKYELTATFGEILQGYDGSHIVLSVNTDKARVSIGFPKRRADGSDAIER